MQTSNFDDSVDFFTSIRSNDLNQVELFIDTSSHYKQLFNEKDESAVGLALRLENFQIYELLVAKGFTLGPREDFESIIDSFSVKCKTKLREIHKRCAKSSSDKHLIVICSNCKLSHTTPDEMKRPYLELISKAFESLNLISWIKPILMVVAEAGSLEMIFDFDRDSIEIMDPTSRREVNGRCYYELGDIYIGARGLLNDDDDSDDRLHVLGVLAHEMTHFAMNLIYENECKPFYGREINKKEEFDRIIALCATKQDIEPYISYVYFYPEKHQAAELIVRVPHLLTLKKSQKLYELKKSFHELFNFFEENTLKDIQRELPFIKTKFKIRDLNQTFGVLSTLQNSQITFSIESTQVSNFNLNAVDKFLEITSNCPQVTMNFIHQHLTKDSTSSWSNIYVKNDMLKNKDVLKSVESTCSSCSKAMLIVDCSDCEEITNIFENLKKSTRTIFISDEPHSLPSQEKIVFKHSWKDLSIDSQESLMKRQIYFQGFQISISELFTKSSKAIEAIPLKSLLSRDLRIAELKPMLIIDYFVERRILPTISKIANSEAREVEYSMNDIVDMAASSNLILLSDEPGMGKTVELIVLAKKLKSKFLSRWLIFLDLKEHVGAFERDGMVSRSFDKRNEIAEYFCDKILKTTNFEKNIFIEIFVDNRVIFVFDGVDEISPSFKQFVVRLIGQINKMTKNIMLISTRPHLARELEATLNHVAFKLKPFSKENRIEFFKKFLKHKPAHEKTKIFKKIYDFSNGLKRSDQDISFRNPLLMRMIAENLDEIELSDSNCYQIYNSFVHCLVDRFMDKGCEAKIFLKSLATTSANIFELHQKHAIESIFQSADNDTKKLINLFFNEDFLITDEETVRIGLMYDDGFGKLHFVHRTFSEFFVSDFLFKKISNFKMRSKEEIKSLIKLFMRIARDSENYYKVIRVFVDKALQTSDMSKHDSKWCSVFEKCIKKYSCTDFFNQLVDDGLLNIIKFISGELTNHKTEIYNLWRGDKNCTKDSVFITSAEFQSLSFIKGLWSFASSRLSGDKLKQLLLVKNDYGKNVFHYAIDNSDLSVIEFLIKTADDVLLENELKAALSNKNKLDQDLMAQALTNYNQEQLQSFLKILNRYLNHNLLRSILHSPSQNDSNLMRIAESLKENVVEVYWNFLADIFDVEAQKSILLHENANKQTALHYALINGIEINQIFIKNLIESNFGVVRMREILLQDEDLPKNVLYNAMRRQQTGSTRWILMQSLFDDEVIKKLLIRRGDEIKNVFEVWKGCKFLEETLKLFLPVIISSFDVDEKREIGLFSAFYCAAENCPIICLNALKTINKHRSYKDFLNELLLEVNEKGEATFCLTLKDNDPQVFEKFCEEVKTVLGVDYAVQTLENQIN